MATDDEPGPPPEPGKIRLIIEMSEATFNVLTDKLDAILAKHPDAKAYVRRD